jgi:hypothetical protein
MTWISPAVERVDEPFVADERTMLDGFLDYNRSTFLVKCAGLTAEQLAMRSAPPSTLSLLGLVRHLTDVEITWFRRRFGGQEVASVYATADRLDAAFDDVDPARAEAEVARLVDEWQAAREAIAGLSLDHIFVSEKWGEMSLRWGYSHMIAEYSRHNGHADLLRQGIDGVTGA